MMKSVIQTAACAAALLLGGVAQADTIATFADPSPNGSQPLFTFASAGGNGSLSGSWSGLGLTLLTPGLAAPDFANARFSMDPVTATGGPTLWNLGSGRIRFQDSGGNDLFFISFSSGALTSVSGFGGSDFVGNNVIIQGPIITTPLSQEAFAFSFANPVGTPENYTATSSFTSSAIPEPAALGLLLIGSVLALRRR